VEEGDNGLGMKTPFGWGDCEETKQKIRYAPWKKGGRYRRFGCLQERPQNRGQKKAKRKPRGNRGSLLLEAQAERDACEGSR